MFTKDNHKIILKIRGGSYLYGLNTDLSDEDYIGIFLNKKVETFGLETCDIIEENIISKLENGKNSKDAIDCKYYSLDKFCRLAMKCNPTILEILFVNGDNIIYCDEYGKKLLDNKHLFISQNAKNSFLGYAISQKNKSFIKSENLKVLTEVYNILNKMDNISNCMLYDLINDNIKNLINTTHYPDYITIGDLNFNNQKAIDVKNSIKRRLDNAGNRSDNMLKHGLDYKFMSHTVRLLYEGLELLKTGHITFPLIQRDLLMDIKLGKMNNISIIELIEALEQKIKDITINLPNKPNIEGINNLLVDIYTSYYK